MAFAMAWGAATVRGQEVSSFSLTPEQGRVKATLQGNWEPGTDHIVEDSSDLINWHRISPVMKPVQGTLDWGHWQSRSPGAPVVTQRFYRVRPLPPADAAPQAVTTQARGRLWKFTPTGALGYTTQAGWRIAMDLSTITVTSPDGKTSYEHWGHPHENLNGKHMKDWLGTHRTMILPGGAMITLKATGPQGVVDSVSIYDVDQTHKLNMTNNSIVMSVLLVRVGEAAELDGETMRIRHLGNGRYHAENIYTEETSGGVTTVRQEETPLGTTGGDANPNQVNDYYDDPRLGHT